MYFCIEIQNIKQMKKILFLFTAFLLMSFTSAHQDHINVNTEASTVKWIGAKMTESHNGDIKIKSGKLVLDHGRLVGGEFVIDMATINTLDMSEKYNEKLNSHLRNEDFFNVKKFPTAKLSITDLQLTERTKYEITADLTIKGKTHSITFNADVKIQGNAYLATANFKIDRTKWDIKYKSGNFFKDLGDKAILDEIEFDIFLLSVK